MKRLAIWQKFGRVLTTVSPASNDRESPALPAGLKSADESVRISVASLEIQRNMATALLRAASLSECLNLLLTAAIRLTGYDSGAAYLRDETSGALSLIAHKGLSADFVARVAGFPRDSDPGRMVEAGEMVCCLSSEAPPQFAETLASEDLEAMIMVPLREKEQVVACLNISSRRRATVDGSVRLVLGSLVTVGEVSIAALHSRDNLLREERLSRLALEGAKLGIWKLNLLTDELVMNARSRGFFGYSEDEPLVFQHCLDRIHPDDRETMMADFEKAMLPGGGCDWRCETRVIHPDHGILWILGLGKIERDADGRTLRVCGINMDVTESKLLEKKLRDSEEKYRRLHESMKDAYVCVDMDGRILEYNRSYQEMLGYSDEELRGLTYFDITPGKWHDFEYRIVIEQVIPLGYSQTYEKEYLRKDGTILPVELRTFLIRDADGNPSQMWAIVRDISERKEAEIMMRRWNATLEHRVTERTAELKQSEDRFRQLAEATFEGISISEHGILLDANPQLAAIHGYEVDEMIGRPIVEFIAPESRKLVAERIRSSENSTYEAVGLRKDGSKFPEGIRAREWINQDRKIRVTALRDLTKSKASEAWILAQKTEIEEVQRLALVSEIAAGIIHQLGQPLSSMGADLVTAINSLESCRHADCQSVQVIRNVEENITRMRDIVIHLRSIGDPNRTERGECHLNQIVEDVTPILKAGAYSHGILLTFEFDVDLPPVTADSVQLSQVVLNLATNAFEACAEQIPELRNVRISTHRVGRDWVETRVRDSGVGILPEAQDRLFRPFFSTKTDGLGVGLRLSRTIMEAHGGTVTGSNNEDGAGATFCLRLPVRLA